MIQYFYLQPFILYIKYINYIQPLYESRVVDTNDFCYTFSTNGAVTQSNRTFHTKGKMTTPQYHRFYRTLKTYLAVAQLNIFFLTITRTPFSNRDLFFLYYSRCLVVGLILIVLYCAYNLTLCFGLLLLLLSTLA